MSARPRPYSVARATMQQMASPTFSPEPASPARGGRPPPVAPPGDGPGERFSRPAELMDDNEDDVLARMGLHSAHWGTIRATNPPGRVNGAINRRSGAVRTFSDEDAAPGVFKSSATRSRHPPRRRRLPRAERRAHASRWRRNTGRTDTTPKDTIGPSAGYMSCWADLRAGQAYAGQA
jgi:hypothetical protein